MTEHPSLANFKKRTPTPPDSRISTGFENTEMTKKKRSRNLMAPPRLAAVAIASFRHASDSSCFRSATEKNIYRRPIYLADFRRGKEASSRGVRIRRAIYQLLLTRGLCFFIRAVLHCRYV